MYFAAGITTVFALAILWDLQPLENRIKKWFTKRTLRIETNENANPNSILNRMGSFDFINFSNFFDKSDERFIIQLKFEKLNMENLELIAKQFENNSSIKKILWSK